MDYCKFAEALMPILVTVTLCLLTILHADCARACTRYGERRRVPAIGVSMFFPVLFMIFGDLLLPAEQLLWPTLAAFAIAIYVAGFDTLFYGRPVRVKIGPPMDINK